MAASQASLPAALRLALRWLALAVAVIAGAADAASALHLRVEATAHSAGIRRLAVSPNGELVATAGDDKTGRIWRAADQRLLAVLRVPIGEGDMGRLYGVAFSPDGRELALAGTSGPAKAAHRIDVFGAGNGVHSRTLLLDAGNVVRLLWTRDGRHLAACLSGHDGVRVVDARTGRLVYSETFAAPCFGLAELVDGSILASGWDGRIRQLRADGEVWRLVRQVVTEIVDPQVIAVSPDGAHFAVGYRSRLSSGSAAVDVFDARRLAPVRRFTAGPLRGGSLGSVAWSGDGRTIAASGRADHGDGRHVLVRIGWPHGDVQVDLVATDTVHDMAPLGADRFALASGNGAWSTVAATGPVTALESSVVNMRGADNLYADDALQTVAFGGAGPPGALRFSLPERRLQPDGSDGLSSARRLSFFLPVTQWQDHYRPAIAGRPVEMDALEISRAYALLPDSAGVVLGTSRTLRRFDAHGTQQWSRRLASEVRGVTVSRDGRLIASAQLDGTVRWWRASDGELMLSLFVTLDGRWVLWTETGYYDAGVGAEALIGWHVNRADGVGVDFFSIGKFRDKYFRPDVIDAVLQTLDPQLALRHSDDHRNEHVDAGPPLPELVALSPTAAAVTPTPMPDSSPVPTPLPPPASMPEPSPLPVAASAAAAASALPPASTLASTVVPDPRNELFPPVVSVFEERSLSSPSTRLRVAFSVRASNTPADTMMVRINGRPTDLAELTMPHRQDGQAMGHLVVDMPAQNAEVSVMALAGSMVSEPVQLAWVWRPVPPDKSPAGSASTQAAAGSEAPSAKPGQAKARLFVVAVGVSKYARKEYELGLAAKDAIDFAALMNRQGGRHYASVQSRVLTDASATRAAVLSALDWLRQAVGPADTAMLFIAGHGVNDARGHYYFMPQDADVDKLARSSVSEEKLRTTLAGIKGRAVLFVDTCFAGNVVGKGAALNTEISRLANSLAAAENGVIVFSSSTGRQPSIEKANWGNGAFTKALIDGLQGGADFRKEGVVTHQGLSYYLGREVAKLTLGRQTPVTAVPLGVVDYAMVTVALR